MAWFGIMETAGKVERGEMVVQSTGARGERTNYWLVEGVEE